MKPWFGASSGPGRREPDLQPAWLVESRCWRAYWVASEAARRWVEGSAIGRFCQALARAVATSWLARGVLAAGAQSRWAEDSRVLAALGALAAWMVRPLVPLRRWLQAVHRHPWWQGSLLVRLCTVDAGLAFVLAFVPLSYGLLGYLPPGSKYATEGVLGLLAVATLLDRAARWDQWRWSALDLPALTLAVVAVASALVNGSGFVRTLFGLRALLQYYVLAWVLTQQRWTADRLWRLVRWTAAWAFVLALLGIGQWVLGVETPSHWVDMSEAATIRTRAFSTFGNPNTFAAYLVMVLGPALAMWARPDLPPLAHAAAAGLVATLVVALVCTYSRSAWLGFALVALVVGLARDRRIPVLMGVGAVLLPVVAPGVAIRLLNAVSPTYVAKSLSGGRLEWWRKALQLFQHDPVLGLGPGSYGGSVANYLGSKAYHLVLMPEKPWELWVDSQLFQVLAELGTLGLLAFVWILATAWSCAREAGKAPEPWRSLAVGAAASLAGIAWMSLFASVWEMQPVAMLIWGYMALLAIIARDGHQLAGGNPLPEAAS